MVVYLEYVTAIANRSTEFAPRDPGERTEPHLGVPWERQAA
jgi:hypothetical protein